MASPNIDNLALVSSYPIDKVVLWDTITVANDGNTTATGSGGGYQSARVVSQSIPNKYGKKAHCRFSWSTNNNDFNSLDTRLLFDFTVTLTDVPVTSTPLYGLQAGVSVGVNSTNITFVTGNGYHGNVSKLVADPSTTGYTPIPQTFTINYALYALE